LVKDSNTNLIAASAARHLAEHGISYESAAKETWDAIAKNVLELQDSHIRYATLKGVVQDLAKSGYKEEDFWKELRNVIVSYHRDLDGQTIIDLRNTHVEYFPQ
jgi:uncharacterized DUF497 family protein